MRCPESHEVKSYVSYGLNQLLHILKPECFNLLRLWKSLVWCGCLFLQKVKLFYLGKCLILRILWIFFSKLGKVKAIKQSIGCPLYKWNWWSISRFISMDILQFYRLSTKDKFYLLSCYVDFVRSGSSRLRDVIGFQ